MCTAIISQTRDTFFGRNLDYDQSFHEEVDITPRNYPLTFKYVPPQPSHYAIIGMATVMNDYPLYYDAINEHGLAIAGLNFPGNATYFPAQDHRDNIAQFELIPWLLGQAKNLAEAKKLLLNLNLTDDRFSDQLPVAELHWMLADRSGASLVLESTRDGLHIYNNPLGVMTNNPPFPEHISRLYDFINLSPKEPVNNFAPNLTLKPYSRGMGAIGLPGDLSSSSRFIKAAFTKLHSVSENDDVSQFFHLLHSVDNQRGVVDLGDNHYDITIYSSCCNLQKGIYYYTHYDNHQITAVDLHKSNLDDSKLIRFPLITTEQINYQN